MKKTNKSIKNNKLFRNIYILVTSILLVVLSVVLNAMDILPSKYIVVGMVSLFVISIVLLILLFKINNNIIRVFSSFFVILLLSALVMVLMVSSKTGNIISKLTNVKYETIEYSVVVRNNDNNDHVRLSISSNEEYLSSIKDELSKRMTYSLKLGNGSFDMVSDLISNNTDMVVLRSSYLELLNETNTIKNIKVLFNFSIKVLSKNINKSVDVKIDPFIVLISGIDTAGPINTVSRSDVNIIMAVNPNTHKIVLVHIPRDYYVTFNGLGTKDKLTHTGIYGVNMTVKTIEDFMNIDINYYVRINFSTFINLVDLTGDVTLYNPVEFTIDKIVYNQGYITLNSKEALLYSRARKMFEGGDKDRGKNQERVIEAIINNLSKIRSVNKYNDILDIMSNSFVTNMSSDDISDLINFELNYLPKWDIKSYNLNGTNLMTKGTPFYPYMELYVVVPDTNTIDVAKVKILEVISNKE